MSTAITKQPYPNAGSAGLTSVSVSEDEYQLFETASLTHWWRADCGFDAAGKKWHCRKTLAALIAGSTNFPTRNDSSAAYNGAAALEFPVDGNGHLDISDGLPVGGALSIVVVGRAASGDGGALVGSGYTAASGEVTYINHNEPMGSIQWSCRYSTNARRNATSPGWSFGDGPNLIVASHDPANDEIALRINRGEYESAVGGATSANDIAHLRIGVAGEDAAFFGKMDGGDIAEMLIFDEAIYSNSALLASVEGYLGSRYGISA